MKYSTIQQAGSSVFFSLKWRILLVFSIVLLVSDLSFAIFSYRSLQGQFERQRETAHLRYSEEVDGLLMYASAHLQQLGGVIPSFSGMRSALKNGDALEINRTFEDHWALLQFDMGVDTVMFYDNLAQMLSMWRVPDFAEPDRDRVGRWVKQVQEKEYPITALDCGVDCQLYAIVPMLANGRYMGTTLLGSSMAEMVVNLKKISGVDIGLIIPSEEHADRTGGVDKQLPEWKMKIVALTDLARNMSTLKDVVSRNPAMPRGPSAIQTVYNGREYEVILAPLKGLTFAGDGYWVFIEDITAYTGEIKASGRQSLLVGFLGILISGCVLLSILWKPVSRLRRTAKALPLLARTSFRKSRSMIEMNIRKGWCHDEIDVLDDTAIRLSVQLERLEEDVADRTKKLAERMSELANEKDFVTHLLHSCQVVILTQNRAGKVLMVNRHSEILTGYGENEFVGRLFTSFLPEETRSLHVEKVLGRVFSGEAGPLSYESSLVCKNGLACHIAWFHSLLPRSAPMEPVILSVGLDLTKRKQAELRISWFASHDPLTGLLNRRSFQKRLDTIVSDSSRYSRKGALLFLDLDHLKHVNDTSGHQAGDGFLRAVAKRLRLIKRKNAVIGRLGGDEFAVAFPDLDKDGAVYFAEKINSELKNIGNQKGANLHNVTASIGIALFPAHSSNALELLACADIAMYQAKDLGRGGWHLFSKREQAREQQNEVVYWKRKIDQGLTNDNFELFFQPIFSTVSRAVASYEVLLRMRSETGKILTPEKFIGIAERTGIVQTIDRMVISKAIEELASLVNNGMDVHFSVNLSGHSFKDRKLVQFVRAIFKRTGIEPSRLNFEITETAALADIPSACSLMEAIKDLGCSFSLDDFGTGYASFDYLKQLPVDHVKIDQSFVSQMIRDSESFNFVKGLTEILIGFRKKIVAEGVEDSETMDLLQKFGVHFAQGFFLGRPVSSIKEYYYRNSPEAAMKSVRNKRKSA